MKKLFLLLAIILFGFSGQSQSSIGFHNYHIQTNPQSFTSLATVSIDFRAYGFDSIDFTDFGTNNTSKLIDDNLTEGTRFINDFQPGNVIGYAKEYLLRYDAFNDQMEIKNNDGTIVLINKETINGASFKDGTTYTIYNYFLGDKNINGYLKQVIKGSTISLLKKELIKYVFPKKAESGYDNDLPATYKKGRDIYFIADHNGTIHSFTKKKEFLALFPTVKNQLEKYWKSNKIKMSDEASLVKLIQYVDALKKR